ncbi:unnamed protein product [Gongylonema pulchrum]|uniref:Uncharacterized protein n=1 Tax=Gongylonema pulchrum TaxID=637853 RepID=A0A3P6S806_9BILA|nr:unnamed protein product [Gongylonema pulchrum]
MPQSFTAAAAAGLFNTSSNLMSLGNTANLQQALYSGSKNPYSNTLEQLAAARQKRDDDCSMQSAR